MERAQAFMIRLCSDKAAYEAVPKKRFKVDLEKLKRSLERAGNCEITLSTRHLIVIKRSDAIEVTIVDDGRLIIRNVADEQVAQRIAEAMLPELSNKER